MENIPIGKEKILQLEKNKKYSSQKKENIPIRERKILQLEKGQLDKGKYSNQEMENISNLSL